MNSFLLLPACLAGYLLGSVNSSILAGRMYGRDIRKEGSGNAGLTNTLRVMGKNAAAIVLTGDLLKGILAYLIGLLIAGSDMGGMIAGAGAIAGHVWPLYFGFKGGKGVLTSFAVLLMTDWVTALALLAVFILVVAVTRYVSLGSLVAAVLFPVVTIAFGRGSEQTVFSFILMALLILMHRANLKRLFSGTESKLGTKRS